VQVFEETQTCLYVVEMRRSYRSYEGAKGIKSVNMSFNTAG
jgi:hypothetical protein